MNAPEEPSAPIVDRAWDFFGSRWIGVPWYALLGTFGWVVLCGLLTWWIGGCATATQIDDELGATAFVSWALILCASQLRIFRMY